MVSRALSYGIIGGGGPAGFGGGAGACVGGADTWTNCWLILLLSLSWFRKRRNQPLERFDFLSSVNVLAVRLGGLEVVVAVVVLCWVGPVVEKVVVDACSS